MTNIFTILKFVETTYLPKILNHLKIYLKPDFAKYPKIGINKKKEFLALVIIIWFIIEYDEKCIHYFVFIVIIISQEIYIQGMIMYHYLCVFQISIYWSEMFYIHIKEIYFTKI